MKICKSIKLVNPQECRLSTNIYQDWWWIAQKTVGAPMFGPFNMVFNAAVMMDTFLGDHYHVNAV